MEAKAAAEGKPNYTQAQEVCSQVLQEAYKDYISRLKMKIAKLPKGSKQWWSLSRELLHKAARVTSAPPLRDADGT